MQNVRRADEVLNGRPRLTGNLAELHDVEAGHRYFSKALGPSHNPFFALLTWLFVDTQHFRHVHDD